MVDKKEIMRLLRYYFATTGKITISDEGLVSCNGYVILRQGTKHERLPVAFDRVDGNFHCTNNYLTTLEGAPNSVSGDFACYNNQLTFLKHAPNSVGGDFYCGSNDLTTLEGAPKSVIGMFDCGFNRLTTLEGAPNSVGGDFLCTLNQLTTLEGMPAVQGTLYLSYSPTLPLLRCLLAKKVVTTKPENSTVQDILNQYAGQGEAGAFECGAELATAGYKENARW